MESYKARAVLTKNKNWTVLSLECMACVYKPTNAILWMGRML